MQEQGTGSRRMSAAEPSQESMEQAILSTLLADTERPVWSHNELAAEFYAAPIVFSDAFNGLRSAGVLNVSGDLVLLARAVRHASDLHEI